jgi:hypothetical protein
MADNNLIDFELFDAQGTFTGPAPETLARLPADCQAAIQKVRLAHEHCVACETELSDTTKELTNAVKHRNAADNAMIEKFPKRDFIDLWRENHGRDSSGRPVR